MSTSRIPAVVAAFKALMTSTLTPLPVVQGKPTTDVPAAGLYIAATDEDDEITFEQTWAGQGHLARNETFEFPNLLFRRTGDNDQTTVASELALLFTDLAVIETALRTDPTLGISGYTVRAQFGTDGAVRQIQSPDGLVSRVRFTVKVETRI